MMADGVVDAVKCVGLDRWNPGSCHSGVSGMFISRTEVESILLGVLRRNRYSEVTTRLDFSHDRSTQSLLLTDRERSLQLDLARSISFGVSIATAYGRFGSNHRDSSHEAPPQMSAHPKSAAVPRIC